MEKESKWYTQMQYGLTMLREAGIRVHYLGHNTSNSKSQQGRKVLDTEGNEVNGGHFEDGKCNFTGNTCASSFATNFLDKFPCPTCDDCIKSRLNGS